MNSIASICTPKYSGAMATDVEGTVSTGLPPTTAAPVLVPRPPELAQLVWRRALALVDPREPHDRLGVALDLLRVARHNPAVLAHASTLGRTRLWAHPEDDQASAAAKLLHAAIAFLGVKPSAGDVHTRNTSRSAGS